MVTREISVLGSCASSNDYAACLALMGRGAIQVGPMISAAVPLERGPEMFDRLYQREPNSDQGHPEPLTRSPADSPDFAKARGDLMPSNDRGIHLDSLQEGRLLREFFQASDYVRPKLASWLASVGPPSHSRRNLPLLLHQTREPSRINTLVRWFIIGHPVEEEIARAHIPEEILAFLTNRAFLPWTTAGWFRRCCCCRSETYWQLATVRRRRSPGPT